MNRSVSLAACCSGLLLAALLLGAVAPVRAALSLPQAIEQAQRNDPWLAGSSYRQQALEARSIAAGTLPDPMVDVGFASLPTDTFDFDQEAMTQFKVGMSQKFPRGDSRALERQRLAQLGDQQPFQREDRRARVAVSVAGDWLEAWRAQESIRLIEADRELFDQLVDVAQSSYASALGRTRQQDLVRAQLELTRLEDRLTVLREQFDSAGARLGEWLRPGPDRWQAGAWERPVPDASPPRIELLQPELCRPSTAVTTADIARQLSTHPAIRNLDTAIEAGETGVQLARQKYKPEWSVNASYGYREGDPDTGRARPDLFSVGLSFDLPLFTDDRQDREVQSAVADTEALRTERLLTLRNMIAAFETQRARLLRLDERRELYRSRLLQEMQEQADASLAAYTADEGDFAEVVRARIAELNARIDALNIEVDRLKTISQLNYFFATVTEDGGEAS